MEVIFVHKKVNMKRSSFLKSLIGIPFVKVVVDNLEKPKAELVSTNSHTEMTGTAGYPSIKTSGSVKEHYPSPTPSVTCSCTPTPSVSCSTTPTPSMTRTISISKTTEPHPSVKPK